MHSFCYFMVSTVIKNHTAFHFVSSSSVRPRELRTKINSMLSRPIDATNSFYGVECVVFACVYLFHQINCFSAGSQENRYNFSAEALNARFFTVSYM